MGMYTELIIGCRLKTETPKEIINTLQWMMRDNAGEPQPVNIPRGHRVSWMLRSAGSYYFGATSPVPAILSYDEIAESYRFHARFNIKNYEKEIDNFLAWLRPHVEQGSGIREMWAIVTYEESDPVLHFLREAE